MLLDYLHVAYPSLPHLWAQLEAAACMWIVISLLRYTPKPGTSYRFSKSLAASILLAAASIEFIRGAFGLTLGVSPYLVTILFVLAWRLHRAGGNIARLNFV